MLNMSDISASQRHKFQEISEQMEMVTTSDLLEELKKINTSITTGFEALKKQNEKIQDVKELEKKVNELEEKIKVLSGQQSLI